MDRRILQENLYGVDLNAEAVQICRLSLWIKTAQRGKQLTSLDHTIRVGNSVVDDPTVHPQAFDWPTAFPEVTASGGFDVVVGNPPYIRQEWLKPYKAFWEKRFQSYSGTADIFTYFFELGIERLRKRGRLGFITSGSWVRSNFGSPLRKFLAEGSRVESVIDFGEFQPFEGAEMIRPTIAVFRKESPGGQARLFKWLTSGRPPENLSEVIGKSPTLTTRHLDKAPWDLEGDEVRELRQRLCEGHRTLGEVTENGLFRGVITGLTDAFVVSDATKERLIDGHPDAANLLQPYLRGQDIKPWSVDWNQLWMITIPSSTDRDWPWSEQGENAETVFRDAYPTIFTHLAEFRDKLIKRQDQGRFWWELRSCAYWDQFRKPKVFWPDIAKLPRFSLDLDGHLVGNTAYFVTTDDSYILGVLSSWATWFVISKTAQPLRLRGDRWQYRLFAQFMRELPIPNAANADQKVIATLAESANRLGQERYTVSRRFQQRLMTSFGEDADSTPLGTFTKKAQAWHELSLNQLGAALKTSFKLKDSPFQSPRVADEWEPYLAEKKAEVERLSRQLADAEAELNDRVYRLFDLTRDEIQLLQREVEH